ncbi:substrate-binding domain-containing protein [Zhihengliuella halotolerans]|uniref:GntR family transcriptional regulator n=1 Tax=Zhihengliuella halotolerans TaxID=370736 RepID=A0A4Q8AE44_9MICC|nr:substrate-binding domain-containing protein [Zhihengliuella halotolerans]RZU62540.1 GntR family transcriptional regulator [Zhihengliuella halotolerans]
MSPEEAGGQERASRPKFGLQRREYLLETLRSHGSLTVRGAAAELGVSELTVRRDINALEKQGLLSRVHGGAVPPSPVGREGASRGTGEGRAIGMVVPSLDYYWPQVVNGARRVAEAHRIKLQVRGSSYDPHQDRAQAEAILSTGAVSGLIIAPTITGEAGRDLLAWLDALPVPVVLAERRAPEELAARRLEWVRTDHAHGAQLAVRHLAQRGHRRIGYLTNSVSPTSAHVVRGWHQATEALGVHVSPVTEDFAEGTRERSRDKFFDELLDRAVESETTALVVHSDVQAVALAQHCQDRGLRIPEDLAIVAYDDEVADLTDPALSAVRPPKHHVGASAVQLLAARIAEGRGRPVHRLDLIPELIVRGSS